jgi:TolB-like protein/Tfp pilus assembly protein PilF
LADAVSAAHQKEITHRDLKPANVIATADGRVKVLDFGVAKLVEPSPLETETTELPTSLVTTQGCIVGTVAYMSPEQAEGKPVDHRTDIFSLGVMLYELATGARPFRGDTNVSMLASIIRDIPRTVTELRPALPRELSRIIKHCLVKDPEYRYQSAKDLRNELRELQQDSEWTDGERLASTTHEQSTAVLPFANMSADPENQYFSDGLAEELINALTRVPGLRVASRTSAFRFRGADVDIRQVGKGLQVATVVEGSVRRAGSRLRVTVQLINVEDGYHLWSERYDRQMADVFDIQDEIVEAIVKAIAPALVGDARKAVRRSTGNLEAYELYLKGRHHWHLRTPSAMRVAQQSFEQVITLDSEYALAYAGLADCFSIRRVYGWIPAAPGCDRAHEAITRAIALDTKLAEVHLSHAAYVLYFEAEWRGAEASLRQAIAVNPQFAGALAYLGFLQATDGRAAEALAHSDLAIAIDPLSTYIHYLAAVTNFVAGRFDGTEQAARRVLELQPDALPGLWTLGLSLTGLGRHRESVAVLERAVVLSRAPMYVGLLGLALARAGRAEEARQFLDELADRSSRGEYVIPSAPLSIYVGLGDHAGMRRALEACIADGAPYAGLRAWSGPFLDEYRDDSDIARLHDKLRDGALEP